MNWFFTGNHIAINLDLVTACYFTIPDRVPTSARLCMRQPETPDVVAIVLLNEDAAKLHRELMAHSPE